MGAEIKTVLFVDDDAQFVQLLQALSQHARTGQWDATAVQTTALALTMLQTKRFDLVVVDLRMPVIDGIQFLQLVRRKHPHLKKVILSGFLDNAVRSTAMQAGADLVLEKPLSEEGFQTILVALDELLEWERKDGFHGVLERVGLEDVLQMECRSRHSLILEVTSAKGRGKIFVCKGDLVHAECGTATGDLALEQLLGLEGGEFDHAAYTEPPQRSLKGSWEFLLMEAARKRDERATPVESPKQAADLPPAPLPTVSEVVACTDEGDLLQAWQSKEPESRCAALVALRQFSNRLEALLPVGAVEHVELLGGCDRSVARLSTQGGLFVRGTVEAR